MNYWTSRHFGAGAQESAPEWNLGDFAYHYGSAYAFRRAGGGWLAERRDNHVVISAACPVELLEKVRADSASNPVPR